jgi:hypothetical protein
MEWFQWISFFAALLCLVLCFQMTLRLIRSGRPREFSDKRGSIGAAVRYSFTGAMSPGKKESAFLHLPTYTAGLLYHVGTFVSLFLYFLSLTSFFPQGNTAYILSGFLLLTALSGLGIFIKRILRSELRALSNPDDFVSNLLVTAVQFISSFVLVVPSLQITYHLFFALFFFYFPVGKLKHTVYFFAARYHLGFFYGWRGIWPPKPR